jgi:chromosome segregation ATPase
MEREFLETFKAVSAEFFRFTSSIHGGSARLIISDKKRSLDGGLEIERACW